MFESFKQIHISNILISRPGPQRLQHREHCWPQQRRRQRQSGCPTVKTYKKDTRKSWKKKVLENLYAFRCHELSWYISTSYTKYLMYMHLLSIYLFSMTINQQVYIWPKFLELDLGILYWCLAWNRDQAAGVTNKFASTVQASACKLNGPNWPDHVKVQGQARQ